MNTWFLAGVGASLATVVYAQAPVPVAAPEAAAPELPWKTTVAAGASVTRGNSETMSYNGSAISSFKQGNNELRMGVEGNYGESQVTQGSGTNLTKKTNTNINNARVFGEYRRLLTERNYVYGNAELLTDDIADIDYRLMVGPGVGRYFLKSDRQKLSGETGLTYIRTKQAGNPDDTVALRMAERYDLKLSATATFWESLEYLPSVDDFSRHLINSEVGLEAAINSKVSLRVVFQDKYNSDPAPDKEKNDLALIAGLSCKL